MTDFHTIDSTTAASIDAEKNNNGLNYLSVDDYDYELPDSLIARYPLSQRSASKLLYLPANNQKDSTLVEDRLFTELPELLNEGDLIVFNDTKVMKARLFGQKDTGGKLEVLIERLVDISDLETATLYVEAEKSVEAANDKAVNQEHIALCHVKASKALKLGQHLQLADGHMKAVMIGRQDNLFILAFDAPILPHLELYGELPIPPTLNAMRMRQTILVIKRFFMIQPSLRVWLHRLQAYTLMNRY